MKKSSSKVKSYVTSTSGNVSTIFLERALQFLKPGGRLGIILPETYFHAIRQRRVLDFIFKGNNVQYVIDLPQNTFRPYNNAKCIVLIMQKGVEQQEYIDMAVAEEIGHDHQGKPLYRFDEHKKATNFLWDDIDCIMKEIDEEPITRKYTFQVNAQKVIDKHILVPRYYWNNRIAEIKEQAKKNGFTLVTLGTLLKNKVIRNFDGNGSPKSQFKGLGEIQYVRVKDIVNWQVYTDVTSLIPEEEFVRLYKIEKQLSPYDVLFVRRGSYRIGSVAVVSPYNLKCILTREILVLRVIDLNNKYGITPEYLLYALSHALTFENAKNKIFIDTTLPNIADRWKEILIPVCIDKEKLDFITKKVHSIISSQWDALKQIEEMKKDNDVYSV